jgi:surfactin synthase thioesterase subunit
MTVGRLPTLEPVWIVRPSRIAAPRLRLFCFPYAGKGPSVFVPWAAILPRDFEVCGMQLPGKEGRIREQPATSLLQVVRQAVNAIVPYLDRPFALVGHSLGSLMAFEAAREIRSRRGPDPLCLFVSGRHGPRVAPTPNHFHLLPDDELLDSLESRYGPIPASVRADPDLLALFLPALRADLAMIDRYEYVPQPLLSCPIVAFAGTDDPVASIAGVKRWGEETADRFRFQIFPGDHFFINTKRPSLLEAMRLELEPLVAEG